jgi:hypothetical protein
MTCMSRWAALVALIVALGACAGPGAREKSPSASPAPPGVASGNPDQLAAAALGTWATQRDASRALGLIRQAGDLDPQRADLAWLQVRLCIELPGCEPELYEARLRKLDPKNGSVWLGVLSRAQARRDARAEQSLLEAMSQSERFDVYWTTLIWRLATALAQTNAANAPANPPANQPGTPPPTPLTNSLNDVTGWLSRLTFAAFRPVSTACDQQRITDAATRTSCGRIAEAMQRSDTTFVEGLGLGIAQRLTPPGSASAMTLDERVSTLSYRSQAAGAIMQAQVEREKFSAQVVELMKKLSHEQDVSLAILRWAGRPVAPPPDF